ncbi:MAG: helicase domain protein, partial [Actinoallomurus sp.]|nr:helicase domain protein [Actinoallomurus sp.]
MIDDQGELFDSGLPKQVGLELSGGGQAQPEAVGRPLDVPQAFEQASSFQVRDELEKLVQRDLLGPWDGPLEQFPPKRMGPRERYLVGMLGPKHDATSTVDDAGDVPDTETGVGGDASEVELPEIISPQALGRIWASSMGLSFCVPADVDVVNVKAEWGRYDESEQETDDGKKARVWSREPVEYRKEVRLDAEPSYKIALTGEHEDAPGVLLAVTVRPRDGKRVVEIALINGQREQTGRATDTAWLFQSRLTVTALDGAKPIFLPVDDPLDDLDAVGDDAEELHLRLLYRNERRYAAGRNVAVHAEVDDGERIAHELTTTWLPAYNVPATTAPAGRGTPLEHVELSMDTLATAQPGELKYGLQPLIDGYQSWLDQREAEIGDLPGPLLPAATKAVYDARQAANRIVAGVKLLTDPAHPRHADALRAFHF